MSNIQTLPNAAVQELINTASNNIAKYETAEKLLQDALAGDQSVFSADLVLAATTELRSLNNLIRHATHERALLTQLLATRDQLERVAVRVQKAKGVEQKAREAGLDVLAQACADAVKAEQDHFDTIVTELTVLSNLLK